jgi:L-alanine-DL-glutamate epimerase-like enolase superfamily enzyme
MNAITKLDVAAFRVPTETPEADGTLTWESTTLVVVEAEAGGQKGTGYTYASAAAARLIDDLIIAEVIGKDAFEIPALNEAMIRIVRNQGRAGLASMAISAVDTALWDLKARLLSLPLVHLLGAARPSLPVYGSGGFTNYSEKELQQQLAGWVEEGIPRVKMKIGRDPKADLQRVRAARKAIGADAELYVDANSAYDAKEALWFMESAVEHGVTWMEEPVSPDDLNGLRWLRDHAPAGIEIADGEYGHDLAYFRKMLEAEAVDVLMPDATRCGGVTGFMKAGFLCEAHDRPFSSHCAPLLHLHPGCALPRMRHAEYFFDHARIELMLFDGARRPENGELRPDLGRPGLGIALKRADAERHCVYRGGK